MLSSLLRIFIQKKEKHSRFIVKKFMNRPTNGNIMWEVTRSSVGPPKKLINLTESWLTRLFAIAATHDNKYFKTENRAKTTEERK